MAASHIRQVLEAPEAVTKMLVTDRIQEVGVGSESARLRQGVRCCVLCGERIGRVQASIIPTL